MKRIEKKTWPDMFQAILDKTKTFDLRLADFDCEVGDVLVLREYDPERREYTGREIEKEVAFVLKTKDQRFWSSEDTDRYGFQVIGFS